MTIATAATASAAKCRRATICTQYGIAIRSPRCTPNRPIPTRSASDLDWFAAVCRVANGLKRLRIGAIGARPAAFNTVRYSEKILEANGISVEPIDLSEILGRIAAHEDDDDAAQAKLEADPQVRFDRQAPAEALMKMAKLGAVIEQWMDAERTSRSAPFSAGPRWKNISASSRAP